MGLVSLNERSISFGLGGLGVGLVSGGEKAKRLQVPNQGAEGDRMGGDGGDLGPLSPDSLHQVLYGVMQGCGGGGNFAAVKEQIVEFKLNLQSFPSPIPVLFIPENWVFLDKLK